MQQANKNEVRKEIADLINRIKEQSDRIGMQREIPQSELDLILHRIEELHRKTVVWSYLNELPVEAPPVSGLQFPVSGSETAETVVPPIQNTVVNIPAIEEPKKPEPILPVAPKIEPETTGTGKQETGSRKQETGTGNRKDVRSFIGFNEKLMYIRQVFGGNNDAYNAALEQINTMNTWTEAETFLGVLAAEYKWGKENEPVAIFTHTVKQRFI